MAPSKRSGKSKPASSSKTDDAPPEPFKRPPEVLAAFIKPLSKKHVYITHIDSHPVSFKRKIFGMPVAINAVVALLFCWRMYAIWPWYWALMVTVFGHESSTTFPAAESAWPVLGGEIARRGLTMFMDLMLFIFLWPWPVRFIIGQADGSAVYWRWKVGFRSKEIYVRRSRDWDKTLTDVLMDNDSKKIFTAHVEQATSPLLQDQKTGYLLIGRYWNLDWAAMVRAHALVDSKHIALDAFRSVVLLHNKDYGWLCYDTRVAASADEDEKRRQVFLFRDALIAMGKEDLFYRWVEVVQFEATQPGGFGPDKQEAAAKKIRDMFEVESVNFDEVWKEAVGTTAGGPLNM